MNVFLKDYSVKILTIVALLFGIAAIIIVQFWTPTLYGPDGYLHIRMAEFIKSYGLKYDFHWARYSTFAKNFADKDLLYHVLLIPFTQLFSKDIFMGAKVSAAFFGVLFFITFFIMLRLYAPRPSVPLFLLALLISDRFFYLFCWPRQMILVVGLTILGIHFLIEEKYPLVFIVTFLYCLMHVSGPYIFLYAILTESARFINNRRFNLKSLWVTGLAIITAYLVHPHFPNNILVFYLNAVMVPIYSAKWGIELGAEFFPISTRDYLLSYPFLVLSITAIFLTAVFLRPKATLRTQVFLVISSAFFIFSFLSQRYIAHGYPLMLLSMASYAQDYFQENAAREAPLNLKFLFAPAIIIFSVLGLISAIFTYKSLRQFALVHKVFDSHYEGVGKFFKQNIPKGELIFHANWSDSQYFIGVDPDNDYFVTLDPTYMFYYNRRLYDLYRDVSFGRTKDPYDILKNTFKANYGYAGKNYFNGLIEQVRKDARFKIMGEDDLGVVFRLE
ncbi:MAG: hypothetical protein PHC54_06820 [Candidatus Omnitrophica bacterium]|nr:hypothetical protein [Candidatus Omnitrophota bacterium]MDD5592941.1 hypothetical protein [Candidatus Omnitrophota bacterium]